MTEKELKNHRETIFTIGGETENITAKTNRGQLALLLEYFILDLNEKPCKEDKHLQFIYSRACNEPIIHKRNFGSALSRTWDLYMNELDNLKPGLQAKYGKKKK